MRKHPNEREYWDCVSELLADGAVQAMRLLPQHRAGVSCFDHSMLVSRISWRICRALGLDERAAARGGLLHDLYLYNWREKSTHPGVRHGTEHPAIALANAGVPEGDAYHIKNETDSDNGIPLYDIEFETDYGDYDFEVAMADGRIVGADYEVDEEWLDALGGSPITAEEAASIVAGKIPGASAADVDIWEESGDGRGRYEGELFLDGMKYEFELDPRTGRIFDWTADLRD